MENTTGKSLIYENRMLFSSLIAEKLGLSEAIVLQQVHFYANYPAALKTVDGTTWARKSYQQWQKDFFKFWSVRTVQRVFESLENSGVLISKHSLDDVYDRTKLYAIDYKKLGQIVGEA